ncbi:MAG: MaoC family dehydratase [Chloroflexi bacterium]|nr:MaoC family dehydratase [Chloroflexota bacterium]
MPRVDPLADRFFEDFPPGRIFDAGRVSAGESEIVAFASQYDPQTFHTDPEAAKASAYGGLIASGWHTVALTMRQMVAHVFGETNGLGSPGIDELRWLAPVRPGDTLAVRVTVLEARPSRSKPDRGLIRFKVEAENQDGVMAMTLVGLGFMKRRPASRQGDCMFVGVPRTS